MDDAAQVDAGVSDAEVVAARCALHAVAEHLLAGPQHRSSGEIALTVTGTGFASMRPLGPDVDRLDVTAAGVGVPHGGSDVLVPLHGPVRAMAARVGVEPGAPEGLYGEHAPLGVDDGWTVTAGGVGVVLTALVDGAAALRDLDADQEPILWPEHFDVGIASGEVNYGVSPGDAGHDRPYAYVGPWRSRTGDFWNESFGASRPVTELDGAAGILEFFRLGQLKASES